jgi:hypothetical protein
MGSFLEKNDCYSTGSSDPGHVLSREIAKVYASTLQLL